MWRAAGVATNQSKPFKILGLANGCGFKNMSLAQTDRSVCITCLDTADVLEVARDLARRLKVSDRVNFVPGDLIRDDFGQNIFQATLLVQITNYLQPEQIIDLFLRVSDH